MVTVSTVVAVLLTLPSVFFVAAANIIIFYPSSIGNISTH